jgi:uncharacterized alpha-E superfamily protein
MLSRVAKNIYWIARYLERAENTARLVNVNIHLFMDLPSTSRTFGWESLITIMGSNRLFYELYSEPTEDNVINFLLGDTRNLGSIHSALAQARENMRTTRDIVPKEAWEQLNNLYLFVKNEVTHGITKRNRYEFLKQVILGCQQITGIASGTMSRDAAYHFFRLGNYLERADMTTRIVDVRSANLLPKPSDEDTKNLSPFDNIQWMSVLKSLTAYQMYRQHVRLRVKGADVLRFLLQDTEFPRSVFFCLGMVENYLSGLPKNDTPLRAIARLQRQVQGADVRELAYQGLHKFMDDLQIGFGTVYEHIAANYFGEVIPQVRQSQSQSMG